MATEQATQISGLPAQLAALTLHVEALHSSPHSHRALHAAELESSSCLVIKCFYMFFHVLRFFCMFDNCLQYLRVFTY